MDLNRFHGAISGKEREEIVIDFSENPIDRLVTGQAMMRYLLTNCFKGDLLTYMKMIRLWSRTLEALPGSR